MKAVEFFPDEEWLELAENSRYLVSTHGRLYSTMRRRIITPSLVGAADHVRGRRPSWRIIDPSGVRRWVACARAVLVAFDDPPPPGHVSAVKDGDVWNVALTNLQWVRRTVDPEQVRAAGRLGGAATKERWERLAAEAVVG